MELGVLVKFMLLSLCMCVATNGKAFALRQMQMFVNTEDVTQYKVCKELWCDQYSPAQVVKTFKGVFLTEEKYQLQKKKYNEKRTKYLVQEGVKDVKYTLSLLGDGDSCCVTNYNVYKNTTMENVDGDARYIVHMTSAEPPSYQFIPHAYCETTASSACVGVCVLEYVTLTLLIYDPVAKSMVFDQFPLPGYCSCKRALT